MMRRRPLLAAPILALAVFAAACGGGTKTATQPTTTPPTTPTGSVSQTPTPGSATIQVMDNNYMPKTLTVQAGTPVVWLQTGVGTHTITADDTSFDSHPTCVPANADTCMKQGETFVRTFDKPGVVAYHCKVHQQLGMTGEIVVV